MSLADHAAQQTDHEVQDRQNKMYSWIIASLFCIPAINGLALFGYAAHLLGNVFRHHQNVPKGILSWALHCLLLSAISVGVMIIFVYGGRFGTLAYLVALALPWYFMGKMIYGFSFKLSEA